MQSCTHAEATSATPCLPSFTPGERVITGGTVVTVTGPDLTEDEAILKGCIELLQATSASVATTAADTVCITDELTAEQLAATQNGEDEDEDNEAENEEEAGTGSNVCTAAASHGAALVMRTMQPCATDPDAETATAEREDRAILTDDRSDDNAAAASCGQNEEGEEEDEDVMTSGTAATKTTAAATAAAAPGVVPEREDTTAENEQHAALNEQPARCAPYTEDIVAESEMHSPALTDTPGENLSGAYSSSAATNAPPSTAVPTPIVATTTPTGEGQTRVQLLHADEEQPPVFKEPPGTRCGPLPRFCKAFKAAIAALSGRGSRITAGGSHGKGSATGSAHDASGPEEDDAVHDEYENLSPFRHCKFTHFLGPRTDEYKNTLILDLDETLVHTSTYFMPDADAVVRIDGNGGSATSLLPAKGRPQTDPRAGGSRARSTLYIKYRPHLYPFLCYCVERFEVVIFTAGVKSYVRTVVQCLERDMPGIHIREGRTAASEQNGSTATTSASSAAAPAPPAPTQKGSKKGAERKEKEHKEGRATEAVAAAAPTAVHPGRVITLLHRDHCTPTNAGYVKDLYLLGRDLRRTVFIDNSAICGVFQPFNCVQVKDFVRRPLLEEVEPARDAPAAQLAEGAAAVEAAPAQATTAAAPWANTTTAAAAVAEVVDEATGTTSLKRVVLRWDDPQDRTLETLMEPEGLLANLSRCDDIPRYIARMMLFNEGS